MIVYNSSHIMYKYERYVELYNKNLQKWGKMANPLKSFSEFSEAYEQAWAAGRSKRWSAEATIKKIVSKDTTKISHMQAVVAARGKKTTYWKARYGDFWDLIKESYENEKNRIIDAGEDPSGKALKHFIATTFFGSPE